MGSLAWAAIQRRWLTIIGTPIAILGVGVGLIWLGLIGIAMVFTDIVVRMTKASRSAIRSHRAGEWAFGRPKNPQR